jgi:hypothetical protein
VSTAAALFVQPASDIFDLVAGSRAIDAGLNLAPDVVTDIDGVPRPQGSAYDIGCFEMP